MEKQREVMDFILFLSRRKQPRTKPGPSRGRARAAAILKRIATKGGMKALIPDPAAWQRKQRKDRPLPLDA